MLSAEAVCDLVAFVNQDGESVMSARMRLDFIERLARVGIDADEVDATRPVVFGELLHALVVSFDDGTARGDEDENRSILALEFGERFRRAVHISQVEI